MTTCTVYTFKEGLLSAVAHDLKIRVGKLEVSLDDERAVTATFDATSLEVVCARKHGQDDPGALSAKDRATIGATMAADVLESRRFPEIRFASTAVEPASEPGAYRVRGKLTLHGVTREIAFSTTTEGSVRVAEVTLHQPDFGIAPYRAMLGTLKLKPDVRVRVEVP